jgi:hypothetical protein
LLQASRGNRHQARARGTAGRVCHCRPGVSLQAGAPMLHRLAVSRWAMLHRLAVIRWAMLHRLAVSRWAMLHRLAVSRWTMLHRLVARSQLKWPMQVIRTTTACAVQGQVQGKAPTRNTVSSRGIQQSVEAISVLHISRVLESSNRSQGAGVGGITPAG